MYGCEVASRLVPPECECKTHGLKPVKGALLGPLHFHERIRHPLITKNAAEHSLTDQTIILTGVAIW